MSEMTPHETILAAQRAIRATLPTISDADELPHRPVSRLIVNSAAALRESRIIRMHEHLDSGRLSDVAVGALASLMDDAVKGRAA